MEFLRRQPKYMERRANKDKKRLELAAYELTNVALFKLALLTREQLRGIIKDLRSTNNKDKAYSFIDSKFERITLSANTGRDFIAEIEAFQVQIL